MLISALSRRRLASSLAGFCAGLVGACVVLFSGRGVGAVDAEPRLALVSGSPATEAARRDFWFL
jgi:hypothetical protein